jgi:hypothetical protein
MNRFAQPVLINMQLLGMKSSLRCPLRFEATLIIFITTASPSSLTIFYTTLLKLQSPSLISILAADRMLLLFLLSLSIRLSNGKSISNKTGNLQLLSQHVVSNLKRNS